MLESSIISQITTNSHARICW